MLKADLHNKVIPKHGGFMATDFLNNTVPTLQTGLLAQAVMFLGLHDEFAIARQDAVFNVTC